MGKFVVITGVDGCGKTTQICQILKKFQKNGLSCRSIKLASIQGPSYEVVQQKYKKLFMKFSRDNHRLLFECLSMREKIEKYVIPQIEAYSYLLADRYLESIFGIAREYESGSDIVELVFSNIVKPDLAILLDVDLEIAYQRMINRYIVSNDDVTSKSVLKIMDSYYKQEFAFYPFTLIDGNGTVHSTTEKIWNII